MKIITQLRAVQTELKAPKNQLNKFGGYKYRSLESILENVKPLLDKYNLTLVIGDTMEQVGDRYYVKATATLYNDEGETLSNTAYAREDNQTQAGMSSGQNSGSLSSYARKYCINGLFCIDDTKDDDTEELTTERINRAKKQRETLTKRAVELGINLDNVANHCKCKVEELSIDVLQQVINKKEQLLKEKENGDNI